MLNTVIYRAPCPEQGCDDGTGQPFGAKTNFTEPGDAIASLRDHWGTVHAPAHVTSTPIPADFR